MNIYTALKKDHRKVEMLLNELVESSPPKSKDWKALVEKIRDELIPHSRAEEALFYNSIRESNREQSLVANSYAEHALAETELRVLQAMELIDTNWTTLAKKLRSDLLHHISEEENKIFMSARILFSEDEAEKIGVAFEQLKPFIRQQSFGGTTLDLITNLLPRRLVEGFKKHFSHLGTRAA